MGLGDATLTLSLNWPGVPVAPTSHTLRVLAPGGQTLPVSPHLLRSLPHPDRTASLVDVRFGDDGRLFTAGYPSGVVQIWDPHTGKELRRIDSPRGYRGSSDYALTTDRLKTLFVPVEGRKSTKLDDPKKGYRIEYTGSVLTWDLATGAAGTPIPPAKGRGMLQAYLSPDGERLVTVERGSYSRGEERTPDLVRLIDTKTRKERKLGEGWSMAGFSPVSRRVYLARLEGDNVAGWLELFDADGNKLATVHAVKGSGIYWPTVSPDGKHLAVAVSKGRINKPATILLFDTGTNKQVAEFPSGGDFPFLVPAFSPDSRFLACGDYDGNLHLWDVLGRKRIRKQHFSGKGMGMRLAFSPDGKKLAVPMRVKSDLDAGRDPDPLDLPQPRVFLFDLVMGGEPEEIVCPHGWSGDVAFSADGKVLAVGGAGAVHLFDVARR